MQHCHQQKHHSDVAVILGQAGRTDNDGFSAGCWKLGVEAEKMLGGLHCFQKKSVSGIATPKPDMDLVRERLKAALAHAEQ